VLIQYKKPQIVSNVNKLFTGAVDVFGQDVGTHEHGQSKARWVVHPLSGQIAGTVH
jgi:hypothetical protein